MFRVLTILALIAMFPLVSSSANPTDLCGFVAFAALF
jgi:hypothetical protein